MESVDIVYQTRFYYHTTDNRHRQLYYDCLCVYSTYEAAVQHQQADWDGVRDDSDILEYTSVNLLILKAHYETVTNYTRNSANEN